METTVIDGVELLLANPDQLAVRWIGQDFVREQLMAAWLMLDPRDLPLHPRILGRPGVGKTSLAYAAARDLGREVYIVQATMDTRPEDLLVTPVLGGEGKLRYVASGLVTAMIRGGVCVLDEGNRMTEKSWASLAPLLDSRRYVESIVAGIKVHAQPEFRFCTTMNEDASTFEIPEYIHSRLQPRIFLDFPARDEELAILRENLPYADDRILEYVTGFLQRAHKADERYSVRDGINIGRYALKVLAAQKEGKLAELPPEPRPAGAGPAARADAAAARPLKQLKKPTSGGFSLVEGWLKAALDAAGGEDPATDPPGPEPRAQAVAGASAAAVAALPAAGPAPAGVRPAPPCPSPAPVLVAAGPPADPRSRAVRHAARQILGDECLRYFDDG